MELEVKQEQDWPQDIPWRRLGWGASLSGYSNEATLPNGTSVSSTVDGLAPSVGLFRYVVPEQSDQSPSSERALGERVVLLRVAASLTGMVWRYSTSGHGPVTEYLPCIGGVLNVAIGTDLTPFEEQRLHISDVYPKRQEMVLNEVLGTETMERAVERNSVTSQWNLKAGFEVKGLTVGGGTEVTEVQESEAERRLTNNHTINVSHVHHVLTAYHLGQRQATLSIQPRPYEGEEWQLLGGPRRVEGIQDFVVVARVPAKAKELEVSACLTLGFPTATTTGVDLPLEPLNPAEIAEAFKSESAGVMKDLIQLALDKAAEKVESWEKWIEKYERWTQVQHFVESLNRRHGVLMAKICAKGKVNIEHPHAEETLWEPVDPEFSAFEGLLGQLVGGVPTLAGGASSVNFGSLQFTDAIYDFAAASEGAGSTLLGTTASHRKLLAGLRSSEEGIRVADDLGFELLDLDDASRMTLSEASLGSVGDFIRSKDVVTDDAVALAVGRSLLPNDKVQAKWPALGPTAEDDSSDVTG